MTNNQLRQIRIQLWNEKTQDWTWHGGRFSTFAEAETRMLSAARKFKYKMRVVLVALTVSSEVDLRINE